jgi:hypothetical protein
MSVAMKDALPTGVYTTVPRLASPFSGAYSSNTLQYSQWRPRMQTFLMGRGITHADYTEPIADWDAICAAVQVETANKRSLAVALLLNGSGVKMEQEYEEKTAQSEAIRTVSTWINQVKLAYANLYEALPADLRLLVADVPQGYAYGIWSFLEKKFRNVQEDNVVDLWNRFTYHEETCMYMYT